jgi:very-short-patch-repair endonuclease
MMKKRTNLEKIMEKCLAELGYQLGIDYSYDFNLRNKYGYRIDYAFPNYKIGIECDGEHWHPLNNEHDKNRDKFFQRMKWIILRFRGCRILNNPAEIKNEIRLVIENEKNRS